MVHLSCPHRASCCNRDFARHENRRCWAKCPNRTSQVPWHCCAHALSVQRTCIEAAAQVSRRWISGSQALLPVQKLLRWGLECTCRYPATVTHEPRPWFEDTGPLLVKCSVEAARMTRCLSITAQLSTRNLTHHVYMQECSLTRLNIRTLASPNAGNNAWSHPYIHARNVALTSH
jgi:hypothetical protein